MTDDYLMDADCIHGQPWHVCAQCSDPTTSDDDPRPDWPTSEPEIGWEQFGRNWQDTARHYAANADYWRAEVERLRAAHANALDILRDAVEGNTEDGETGSCVFCGAAGQPMGVTLGVPDDGHMDDCVRVRAVALLAAGPTADTPAKGDQP